MSILIWRGDPASNNFSVRPATSLEVKRLRAIAVLGDRWVLHPNYHPNPRHSNDIETWLTSASKRRHDQIVAFNGAADRINNTTAFFNQTH